MGIIGVFVHSQFHVLDALPASYPVFEYGSSLTLERVNNRIRGFL